MGRYSEFQKLSGAMTAGVAAIPAVTISRQSHLHSGKISGIS
jgi:hypothetical protein